MYLGQNIYKRNFMKLVSLIIVFTWLAQIAGLNNIALGAAPYTFKGYENENVTSETFTCNGATKSSGTITMTSATQGEAIGFVTFDGVGSDIATSIDLGGLEVDFSANTTVTPEGDNGSQNDVPSASIDFCSAVDYQDVISSVNITKPDPTAATYTLSSNASIPKNTRSLIIHLYGTNTSGSNTVVFSGMSFKIHDAAAPSCAVSYDNGWTNKSVTVTVNASDADSGLEGIYKDGVKVASTSPYTYTASANTSFSVYSKDYAGKSSDTKNVSITNIDTTAPSAPASITLSKNSWTNQDVTVTLPALGTSTGAPEKYTYSVNGGSYKDVPADFKLTDTGTYNISVKTADAAGNVSSSAVSATAYIDKEAPAISKIDQNVSSGSADVTVTSADTGGSGLDKMKYASGSHDADYFSASGTDVSNNKFTVNAGGNYTVFVSDKAGNTCVKEFGLNTAPVLASIADQSTNEDTTLNVPLDVHDAESSLDKLKITASCSDNTLIQSVTVNQSASAASLDIKPGANLHGGPVTITVNVEDEGGEKVSRTFNLTVISVNDPPIAQDDTGITTTEGKAVTIDVLANDSDPADGDTLTISDPGKPSGGSAAAVDGKIVYTPNDYFNGSDSFIYTISDGNGGTASATVSITVNSVNDPPVAVDDTAETTEDTSVLIDVLHNDTDPDLTTTTGEQLSLVSVENGSLGTAAVEDGKVRYTPGKDNFGKDTFKYTITDKGGLTCTGNVKVMIDGVNDPPQFGNLNSEYTIDEDSQGAEITFSITDIETPADSLMLQAVSSNETLLKNNKLLITGLKDNDPSVTLKLTPEPNQNGDVTISMVLGDGFLTTDASFKLHINPVNDPPVAKNDTIYYDEDTDCVTIDTSTLIANDTDIDGDTLSFAGIDTTTSIGTLTAKDETNTVYYYHPVKYSTEPDSFIYKVTDGTVTQTAKCTLISKAINHAPELTIHDASYTTDEDTAITGITFSISDHETEAGDLTVTASCDKTSLVSTDGMTVTNNGDGTCSLSITPMPDQNGTAKITVSVSDGNLETDGTFNLVITPEPDPPVAVDDSYYVPVSGSITFCPILNDRDPDGDTLTIKSFDKGTLGGTLTLDDSKQDFKYVARTGETGKYTFTYVVTDGTNDDSATVTLDINTITHPPVISAISDRYINQDGSTGGISFTASDPDYGDSLTVSASSGNTTLVPNDSEHIVLTDNGDGSYSLSVTPAKGVYGYAQITITVTDKQSHTVTRSFGLNVYKVNYPPKAVNDDITTNEDTSVTLNMLSNDSDPEGDSIYISDVSSPSNGYITRSGSTYTYTPYGNFNGTDSVTYWVTDGQSTSAATATIHVTPVNDSPTARNNWATVANSTGSESVNVPVLNNDYDIDGDTLKVYSVTQGKYGTVSINADNTVTYTRSQVSPDDNGADTFTYTIIDRSDATGDYRSAIATVYIGVVFHSTLYCEGTDIWRSEDSAPYTFSLPISNPNNIDYTLSVGTCSLGSFAVVDNPSGNDTKVTFTPTPDANGSASVSYTITGHNNTTGADETDTSYIYVYLYPVDDAPVIDTAPTTVSCDEEASTEIDYTFHDVDDANSALYLYAYAENISSGGPIPIQLGISTVRNGGTAAVTLTPIADTFGQLDIVIGVSDGIIRTERTVHMTINPIDDAPRISDINEEIYEDMDVTFAAVTPSTDVDGDGITVSIADGNGPAHGKAVISGGAITYTPDENWNGTDTIKYTVTDKTAAALSSTKTATIVVDPVNDPPVITGLDYYQKTNEDTPKTIGFTVTDPDSDMTSPDRYTITSSNTALAPLSGIVISHVSGNDMQVTVTPAANAFGKTVIGITANDGDQGHPLSAYAEFELTVISVNDVPVAVDDTASVDEHVGIPAGTTSVIINVLDNDSDVEDGKNLNVVSITNVSKGSVVKNKDGTLTYSVDGDYNGTATFNYTIMDKNGATATALVTVTINPKSDPPSAVDDTVTIDEDQVITVPVLTNDSDPDGDTLTVTGADTCANGTVAVDGTGVKYTPNKDYNGTDSFKYYISDGNGGTASATVTLTIKPENDPPAISKHSSNSGDWTMNEDETKAFNFVVSDPETPVENLIIKIASQKESIIKSTNIKLTSADGYKVITVTPEDNANGVVPVVFNVSDGALTTTQTYDITIAAVNDPPVLTAPARTMPEDAVLNSKVTATDIDSDLSSLVFSKATDPSHGSVTVNADGTYAYTPSANWSGTDSFNVSVSDGAASDTKTEVITVTPVNDPPTAADDSVDTDEDTPVTVNVLSNDTDPDTDYGDSISVTSVGSASHGTAEKVDGGIKYTPSLNWNGTDTFTYAIADKSGKTSSAKVTINVKPVNDAPSGGDDNVSTPEDTPITIEATSNDDIDEITNPGLENLNITAVSTPSHGTAAATEDKKSITYTPAADWNGTDTFTYDVQDIGGLTATFNVTVVVNPVNDAPVITTAMNDVTIDEDNTTTVSFTVNDVDDDVSGLTVTATHPASAMLPALSVTGTGADKSFVITPDVNKNGNIDITVTVTDPHGASSSKTFKLTVNPVNDLPAAKDDTATTNENTKVTIDVLANDDVDAITNPGIEHLTITGIGATQYGTAAIVNNKIDYTPDASRTHIKDNYTDTFTYTMQDGSGATSGASVTVTVTPVNDAPTISDIADVVKDEDNDTGDISFTVNDEEDDAKDLTVTAACTNTTLFPLANIVITNPGTGTERSVKATPAANVFGTATITLTVTDSGHLTASDSFTVTINSVNDVPANGDDHLSVIEDTRTQLNVLVNDDPDYATTPEDLSIKSVDTTTYSTTGTVEIAGDGKSLYYTSKLDDDGTDKFTYTMHDTKSEDTNGGDFTFTVYITITPVNDAPVVTLLDKDGDGKPITAYSVDEGGHVNGINFKVTDSDNVAECGATCEETITVKSSNPVLVLGGLKVNDVDGTVNRTLDIQAYGKWNGNTTLTITAKDKGGLTGTATINFHVNSVNEPPVANDDTFTIPEDKTTTVDVLGNDTDDDIETNPDTEYILVSSVTDNDPNAVIAVSSDGKGVDITPTANYNGPVSFTYVTKDASDAKSGTATVSVTVSQVNDTPVANADTKEISEDTAQTVINVLANDTDVDMDATLNANPSAESLSVSISDSGLKAPAHGTISIDADKNIVYSPVANFNGQDTFEYNAVDKAGAKCKALVTVTVDQVNDNPTAVTDTVSTDEDTALDIYPLANDTDVDTDSALNLGRLDKLADFSLTSESNPSHGTIAVTGGKITYTPSANYFGADSITYDMSDGHSGTAEGTINITVKSVNDLPVFTATPADMPLSEDGADGSSNFTVSDVETLGADLNVTVVSSSVPTLIATSDVTITKGTGGDRTVSVNPKDNQNGSSDIVLRVTDADGGTADYTLKVTVAAVNDTPVAADIAGNIDEDTSYSVSWVTNSSDVDIATNADALTATIETGNEPKHGTASVSGNNLIYTPTSNFNGVDTFTYTVTDKGGLSDTGLVTVTVRQINDAPKANDDTNTTNEDTQATINVLANDTDVDTDATLNADPSAESLSVSIADSGLKAPLHGTITVDASNNIVYTPAANFNGTDSFEYNAVDKTGVKAKAAVNVTIKQVNDAPVAVQDDVSTDEDTAIDIYPLANDTDVDTDNTKNFDKLDLLSDLSLTSETGYINGTIAVAGSKITYTPSPNFFGTDAITYKISDGHGGEGTGTMNITVKSVNDLPVFASKPADMSLTEDGDNGSADFTVSDVETLGTDLNVTVTNSSNPSLVATGDVTITKGTDGARNVAVNPENNQNGSANITIEVKDADGGIADYTFKVSVAAVNDTPVANDIEGSMDEDKTYAVSWKDNSSDVDIATNGDSISAAIKTGAGPAHGTASVSGDNLIYTPAADWNGVDTFTYTVTDSSGASDTGLVTITVKQVDDQPVASDDSITINEDTPTDIYVLGNDTDKDQDAALNANPGDEVLSASITDTGLLHPAHGSVTIPENGSYITYTPAGNYNGTDSFEYNATDKAGAKSKALVTVTIRQVNDNPVAVDDSVKAGNKAPIDIRVLDNDTDVDTDTSLNKDVLHYTSSFSVTSYEFVGTGNGTLSESGGVITFTPDPNFTGIQKIQYTMSDGHGGTATGIVSVNIGGENAPPTAKDDSIETAEDTTVTYNVLNNDTDIDNGDVLSFVKFTGDTSGIPGIISADAGGNLSFTPSANYHGSFIVGYEIEDASAATSTANITITVTPVNDAPDAKDKSVETLEDTPITVDVSTLISDPDIATDSDTLSVSVKTGGAPQHGEFTVSGNAISYTPNANWNGTDNVTYTVTDSHSASDTGVITITVDAVNDPPHANNDTVQTNEDTPATIDVIQNDEDADTDPSLNAVPQAALTIEPDTLGTPSHGTVSVADNKIVYTPEADYNGPDSFTYKATDGTSDSQATVSVTVKQVNDAPVANDDTAQITDGDMVSINVLNNDTDIDTLDANNCDVKYSVSDFSVTSVTQPSNGTAAISGKNVNYTAGATFAGDDSFTYTMSDGHGGTATATVRVKVISVNDPPDTPVVATPKEGERYGGSSTIKVTWSDSDIDGDALKYTLEYYDGSAWQRVASDLTDTTYNFAVPATLTSITDLQFRVSAFDGQYTSSYGYSGHVSVDKDVPMNIVVRMTTSDDKGYTAGTWVNKDVTVVAVSITDASKVTFGYGLDSKTYADSGNQVVTGGEHNVYIKATDEFGNAAEFGGYPVKVDKDAPLIPDKQISVSGTTASVKFTPSEDPGGSGNDYISLPDGTKKSLADGGFTWTTTKDGNYGFTIFDVAGNSTEYTVTINQIDETPPDITCDSGDYVIGKTSESNITAKLTYKDDKSSITGKGYAITESKTFSGAYQVYEGELTLSEGEHYIQAFAKNSAGLETFKTFGPFIVNSAPAPTASAQATASASSKVSAQASSQVSALASKTPTVTEAPHGDVTVAPQTIIKGAKKIRLPGGEWSDSLVLKDIKPGTYLVEVMDENGNVTLTQVTITNEAIAQGVYYAPKDLTRWYMLSGFGLLLLLLLLLFAHCNVKVEMCEKDGENAKVIRTIRRLRRSRSELTIALKAKDIRGSDFGNLIIKKGLTKRMKDNTVIVTVDDSEVFKAIIPDDTDDRFEARIDNWEEK